MRQLNFHFQPNIYVDTTLMNVDDQRCFNVDVFAGIFFEFSCKNVHAITRHFMAIF